MVKAFAPVNIAWIKYMGKVSGSPTNASFSMTLANAGTTTSMRALSSEGELNFVWSTLGYVPPHVGQQKAERFLKNETVWKSAIEGFGLTYTKPGGQVEIQTENSVPAGTGIATSASGFAALALTWLGFLLGDQFDEWQIRFDSSQEIKQKVSELAGLGSGSACRSITGPFVEWDPRFGTHAVDASGLEFVDFILILDQEVKAVSSSEAHGRVLSSPKFSGRVGRAHARLAHVKEAMKRKNLQALAQVVLEEALDMHELFETSDPAFAYMNDSSRAWVKRFQSHDASLPSKHAIVTLDAGANVHVFVPLAEQKLWTHFFESIPKLKFIASPAGKGAHFVES